MNERLWKPSRQAESVPVFQELVAKYEELIVEDAIDLIDVDGLGTSPRSDDDEVFADTQNEIAALFYDQGATHLSPEDHIAVTRLLSYEGLQWGYGEANRLSGDMIVPAKRRYIDDLDLETLIGLTGEGLAGRNKDIDAMVNRLAETPQRGRVLLGTVALVASSNYSRRWEDYHGFANGDEAGITARIEVYGDMHGDFRMRETYQADRIVDPFGREQYAAPALDNIYIAGYHSVEPYILMNVLHHQFRQTGLEPLRQFVDRVSRRLASDSLELKVGPYADWGSEDGRFEIDLLQELIKEGSDLSGMNQVGVRPQGDERLVINSHKDGIVLRNQTSDVNGHAISIKNDKIEDFVVTLIKSAHNHGRTSPLTLMRVLDAVRDHTIQLP